MRAANFASGFLRDAVVLPKRVEIRAKCPAQPSAGCKFAAQPLNIPAAMALDTVISHSTAGKNKGKSLGESNHESGRPFTEANITAHLFKQTDYAAQLRTLPQIALLCPAHCSQCASGTANGGYGVLR